MSGLPILLSTEVIKILDLKPHSTKRVFHATYQYRNDYSGKPILTLFLSEIKPSILIMQDVGIIFV